MGGKQKCVRKKAELSTSAHIIWENRTKSGYSGFPLLCQKGWQGPAGLMRVSFSSPRDWLSCSSAAVTIPLGEPSMPGWLFLASSAPHPILTGYGCDGTPQRVSCSLPPLGALIRLKCTELPESQHVLRMQEQLWIWCLQLSVEEGSSLPCG